MVPQGAIEVPWNFAISASSSASGSEFFLLALPPIGSAKTNASPNRYEPCGPRPAY